MGADLIFWNDDVGVPHVIYADIVPAFDHEMSNGLTQLPVEQGATISDHVRANPDVLNFLVKQTETPIDPDYFGPNNPNRTIVPPILPLPKRLNVRQARRVPWNVQGLVTAGVGKLQNSAPLVALSLQSSTPEKRIERIYESFIRLMSGGFRCKISFRGRDYKDYILTTCKPSYNNQTVGAIEFACTAQKVKTATTQLVAGLADPSLQRALTELERGAAAKAAADAAREQQINKAKGQANASLLKQGANAAEALLGFPQ